MLGRGGEASVEVGVKRVGGGGREGQVSGFPEFPLSYVEECVVVVEVFEVQCEGFSDPQAGGIEQAKEGPVHGLLKGGDWAQLACGFEQVAESLVGEDIGGS